MANETKWTAGPWTIHEDEVTGAEHGIRQAGTGAFIARTMPDLDIPDADERLANAHLLAAAPAMAEALRQIVRFNGSTGGAVALVREFKFIAEQALAKAEGR